MTTRVWLGRVLPVVAAGALLTIPLPAPVVERMFSRGWYPPWQQMATAATDLAPFATFDVWLAAALAGLGLGLARIVTPRNGGGWLSRLRRALVLVGLVAAWTYLWFMASWGLNYRREPTATRLGLDQTKATSAAAHALAVRTISELNRLHPAAWSQPWPQLGEWPAVLAPSLDAVSRQLQLPRAPRPGRPKRSVLQFYFRSAGIDGVTNPFLPEILVNQEALPLEQPMIVAHEWGHLAGLAHEAEASYLAWLLCSRVNDQTRYSAWIWILGHVVSAVPPNERRALMGRLEAGPRRDLAAMAARDAHLVPAVRTVAWGTYDRYLKSNAVDEGLASYDAALALILATPDAALVPVEKHFQW